MTSWSNPGSSNANDQWLLVYVFFLTSHLNEIFSCCINIQIFKGLKSKISRRRNDLEKTGSDVKLFNTVLNENYTSAFLLLLLCHSFSLCPCEGRNINQPVNCGFGFMLKSFYHTAVTFKPSFIVLLSGNVKNSSV